MTMVVGPPELAPELQELADLTGEALYVRIAGAAGIRLALGDEPFTDPNFKFVCGVMDALGEYGRRVCIRVVDDDQRPSKPSVMILTTELDQQLFPERD